jgi:lipid II:glycine glycyltransferase (peptidoglycan interpeptide bridge formation enzyme)
MPELTPSAWESFLAGQPRTHLLQSEAWGRLKADFGWEPVRVVDPSGAQGAQLLFRRLPLGWSLAYLPKGPVGGDPAAGFPTAWDALWPEIDRAARRRRAIFLKVEPDLWEGEDAAPQPAAGFVPSAHAIQPPRTLRLDLSCAEAELLASMKQKTRYNVRLAEKKGVSVRLYDAATAPGPATDALDEFARLMQVTGSRDAFGVHAPAYYRRAYELFAPRGECALLLADYAGQALSGLMVFARGGRAWYLYGASANEHREVMAPYLLQWRAIQWAQARGCQEYDLWGVPDASAEVLEAGFESGRAGLWGVYRFKRGFGGRLSRAQGPWDRVYWPPLYWLYRRWMARRGEAHD